jgi:hypothetical protein
MAHYFGGIAEHDGAAANAASSSFTTDAGFAAKNFQADVGFLGTDLGVVLADVEST